MLKNGLRNSGRTGNWWTFCTETISDQVFPLICSLYSTIHKTLFPEHYFKLIQSIHFQIHLLHSFCLIAWSQSSKDLIYPSEKGKKRLISFWSVISKEYANVSKLVFVTFSFNTNILLQVTNDYIKNLGNDHHITAVTGMLASGHQGLISTKVVLPFQKYKGS